MPEQTTHPSQAALAAYNLGQLPPEEAAAIENHIAECERCCETTYLVRRIEHVLKSDGIYAEWTTTYNPTIDVEITDKILEFDQPSLPGADDNVDVSGQTRAEDQQSRHIESVSR
ncbi:MAG: zf-HC2 domain-containing protein [Pirellulaceae bacterium]|nr:zf-HC2 domain-containing protein [Pirellulaceae bacterium]